MTQAKTRKPSRLSALKAQQALQSAQRAVVLVIAGVEGSGRHAILNALTHHFDTRGLRINAWLQEGAAGQDRPALWRYWQHLPRAGEIGLFLNGWYADPILAALRGQRVDLTSQRLLENQLQDAGASLIKLWISADLDGARKRLRGNLAAEARLPTDSEVALLAADAGAPQRLNRLCQTCSPWQVIDHGHGPAAVRAALSHVVQALTRAAAQAPPPLPAQRLRRRRAAQGLAQVDLTVTAPNNAASRQRALQHELSRRVWAAHNARRAVVLVLEGWDAAGKGGVIRRVTDPLDARLFQVVPVSAPSPQARQYPYLWRFWRQLPTDGQMTVFDRSWYGRVLVERVEGTISAAQCRRAYDEINDFEQQMVSRGTVLVKCWLHISPDEQLRRFNARARQPHKRHKLTDEDWRNRERWDDYVEAADDMFAYTDRADARWHLVAAEDKAHARLTVLHHLCEALTTV